MTKYNYLSSWLQAIGSLLAVWATYNVYRLSAKAQQKREVKKELKDIDNERKIKEIAELNGQVIFLSNKSLRLWMTNIDLYLELAASLENSNNKYANAIQLASKFSLLGLRPLSGELFEKLVDAFGSDVVDLQKVIMRLTANFISIEQSLKMKENDEKNSLPLCTTPEDLKLLKDRGDFFDQFVLEIFSKIIVDNKILKEKFLIIRKHALVIDPPK